MSFFVCGSTFGMVDSEETCIVVMVYNMAHSWGVLIGDTVVIPEPLIKRNIITHKDEVGVFVFVAKGRSFILFLLMGSCLCFFSVSRLISEVYGWTLLCYSSSTARNKMSIVRLLLRSAASPTENEPTKTRDVLVQELHWMHRLPLLFHQSLWVSFSSFIRRIQQQKTTLRLHLTSFR